MNSSINPWKLSTLGLSLALGVVAGGSFVKTAAADQPSMQTALTDLQNAKTALVAASHDHGGFRTKAVKATDEAISDVQQGIAWAEQHPGGGTGKAGGGGTGKAGGGGAPKQ